MFVPSRMPFPSKFHFPPPLEWNSQGFISARAELVGPVGLARGPCIPGQKACGRGPSGALRSKADGRRRVGHSGSFLASFLGARKHVASRALPLRVHRHGLPVGTGEEPRGERVTRTLGRPRSGRLPRRLGHAAP